MLAVYFDGNFALFDDEEQTTRVSLVENILILGAFVNLHLVDDLCPFVFREAREKEVRSDNFGNFAVIFI